MKCMASTPGRSYVTLIIHMHGGSVCLKEWLHGVLGRCLIGRPYAIGLIIGLHAWRVCMSITEWLHRVLGRSLVLFSLTESVYEDYTSRGLVIWRPPLQPTWSQTISALGSFNRDHNSPGPFNRDHNSQGPVGCMLDMDVFTS